MATDFALLMATATEDIAHSKFLIWKRLNCNKLADKCGQNQSIAGGCRPSVTFDTLPGQVYQPDFSDTRRCVRGSLTVRSCIADESAISTASSTSLAAGCSSL